MGKDISEPVLKIVCGVLTAFVVIKMGISFANQDYNSFVARSCFLLFIVAIYLVTMKSLKKEKD
jgi:high-affinity Fe2+/Pb2+ permease